MIVEFGDRDFPIWLISDMEVSNMNAEIKGAFDYRLPMRHIIFTSVLNKIQEYVFRAGKLRIDTSTLYYYNSLPKNISKPNINDVIWSKELLSELDALKQLIETHKPKIIFVFGTFSYEGLRRIKNISPQRSYGSWTPKDLGNAFRQSTNDFNINQTNVIPLLDRSITGWRFLESHKEFTTMEHGDYYDFTGKIIAEIIFEHKEALDIWI